MPAAKRAVTQVDSLKSKTGRELQARAVRTREAVLTAAAEVFERSGFAAATLDEIATKADVTKGALYFHFPSKASLASAVMREQQVVWERVMEASQGQDGAALEVLGKLVVDIARTYVNEPICRAGVRLAIENEDIDGTVTEPFTEWISYTTTLIKRGQKDKSIATGVSPAVAARVLVASFHGIDDMSARLHSRSDLVKRVQEWWTMTRAALTA